MRFELCLQMVMSRLRVAFVIVQILLRFRVLQLDSKDVVCFFSVWLGFISLAGTRRQAFRACLAGSKWVRCRFDQDT